LNNRGSTLNSISAIGGCWGTQPLNNRNLEFF